MTTVDTERFLDLIEIEKKYKKLLSEKKISGTVFIKNTGLLISDDDEILNELREGVGMLEEKILKLESKLLSKRSKKGWFKKWSK